MLTITAHHDLVPAGFAATLASLPLTYAPAIPESHSAVWAVGGEEGWAAAAVQAIEAGARAVVVSRPEVTDHASVTALMDAASTYGTVVELAEPFAGDPVFEKHETEISAHLRALSALVVTAERTATSPSGALLEVVRTVRTLGLTPHVDRVVTTASGIAVHGRGGELALAASVSWSAAASGQRIQGLGFSRIVDIRLHGSDNARPAEITVSTMAAETTLSTVFENADRSAWRRVARRLRHGDLGNRTLATFATDLELACAH